MGFGQKREEVIITIGTDATVTVGVKGRKGKSCSLLTREIEKALGETVSDARTSEYNERQEVSDGAIYHKS